MVAVFSIDSKVKDFEVLVFVGDKKATKKTFLYLLKNVIFRFTTVRMFVLLSLIMYN